jgi:lipopolysaccharide biosynthesis glycosyltransferase
MTETFKFQSVEEGLPEAEKPVLLKYTKGKKGPWKGQTGVFYTQGYFKQEVLTWDRNRIRRTWYDYTDRQIQDLDAPTSKNKVLEWAYIN